MLAASKFPYSSMLIIGVLTICWALLVPTSARGGRGGGERGGGSFGSTSGSRYGSRSGSSSRSTSSYGTGSNTWSASSAVFPGSTYKQRPERKIPDAYLGAFTNGEDKINHISALWNIFNISDIIDLKKGNIFEFIPGNFIEHDAYCVFFKNSPSSRNGVFAQCIPFKLNEKITEKVEGGQVQVMLALVNGSIHAKIRRSWGSCATTETTILFKATEQGIEVSFNGQPKALYVPAMRWYMLGAFVIDPDAAAIDTANDILSYNNSSPLRWTNQSGYSISQRPFHQADEIESTLFYDTEHFRYEGYIWNHSAKHLLEITQGLRVHVDQSTAFSTSLRRRLESNVTIKTEFQFQTITQHIIGEHKNATLTFKRTIPWTYHGTYEDTENDVEPRTFPDDDNSNVNCTTRKRISITQGPDGRDVLLQLGCRKMPYRIKANDVVEQDKNVSDNHRILVSSELGTDGQLTINILSYARYQNGSEGELERNLTLKIEESSNAGLHVHYTEGIRPGQWRAHQWDKYYQRIASSLILGKFIFTGKGSQPGFANSSMEISQLPDGKLKIHVDTFFGDGPSDISTRVIIFPLHTPAAFLSPGGQEPDPTEMRLTFDYMEVYGKVILTGFPTASAGWKRTERQNLIPAVILEASSEGLHEYMCRTTCFKARAYVVADKQQMT
ncbi:uncharacterized protein LOC129588346 isoform X2 [Paramacrobiotus metropolitanus]|uniref:uncharacterized protein LOC129588346 isoform X2 n=1 Tax=Paramacrobiotus metropolitanus TaxID=2943436 RepID=UPI0024457F1A|nr:uncharacterized protein LOC129588346 isoform X2 [Paramacrobiotus metropolitanus]